MCKPSLEYNRRIYPITTAQILVESFFGRTDAQACIDWATAMLECGYDGDYLVTLAGLTPNLNYFEISDYLRRSLEEVGLAGMSRSSAITMYVSSYLVPNEDNETALEMALCRLRDFHIALDYNSDLQAFYLLYYAYTDLKESDIQYYWEGATKENIVSIIYQQAKEYIQSFEKRTDLQH